MNHIYRVIYNTATQTWHVTSEFAKGKSKNNSRSSRRLRGDAAIQHNLRIKPLYIALIAVGFSLYLSPAWADITTTGTTSYAPSPNPVTGANPTWSTIWGGFFIGDGGIGTMTINGSNGGTVTSKDVFVGRNYGDRGTVTVDGANSQWNFDGSIATGFAFGLSGEGTLNITNGGVVNTPKYSYLGYHPGSTGTATVDGSGSKWSGSTAIHVGRKGTGTLTISDGGLVSSDSSWIGYFSAGNGTVTVDGAGSQWINSERIILGGWGSATLNINNGGVVQTVQLEKVAAGTNSTLNFDGGTLRLSGNQGNLFNGFNPGDPIALKANGGTIDTQNFTVTTSSYAVISGTGQLSKIGTGTLTLTGNNTYSGGTAINGGKLSVSANHNLGAATGRLTFNGGTLQATDSFSTDRDTTLNTGGGTFEVDAGKTLTHGGTINGTGGLTKTGAGTLTLTGYNGYRGGTAINGGKLAISSVRNLGDGGGLSFDGGTLQITGSGSVAIYRATTLNAGGGTFEVDAGKRLNHYGRISDSGSLTKTGTGKLKLGYENTYTGATNINAGTVDAFSTSALGSRSAVTIAAGAQLNLKRNFLAIGSLAGAGNVNVDGSNLITGLNNSDSNFSGVISGTGSLTKTGTGTLTLTGNNTYSGGTVVDNGTLSVNGSIANSIATVNNGGTINGSGTVGGLIVNSGGTATAGNASIGTLTVNDDVTFNAGSTYQVETDAAGNSDKIIAGGNATINGGTVEVLAGSGNYNAFTDYTILTANGTSGVSGTFSNVTSNMAFLTPTLSYDANNVYLNLTRNNIQFGDVANTFNQRYVANNGLAGRTVGDPLYDAIAQLNANQARQAYDDLSGEIHNSVHASIINDTQLFSQAMQTHKTAQGSQLWGQLIGQHGTWQADGNAHELERNSVGAVFGYDLPVSGNWTLGLAAGFGHNQYEVDAVHSTAKANQVHIGAYAGRDWKLGDNTLTLRLNSGYTLSDIDVTRQVNIGQSLNNTLNSDYQVHTVQLGGELGYAIPVGNTTIKPYAGLDFISSRRTGLEESGGAAALSSAAHTSNNAFARAGVRLETALGEHAHSRFYANIGVRHAIKDTYAESTNQLASGGNTFSTRGNSSGKTVGIVNIGMNYQLTPAAKLTLNANAAVGSGVKDYGVHVGFKWDF